MDSKSKYGLPHSEIDQIISILKKNAKIDKIVLFGSRAKGNFENGSDVDLAVIGKKIDTNDIVHASIEIDKLSLPYKFDIIIYNRIHDKALLDHIDRVGVVIFER